MTKHFVTFYSPGTFAPEETTRPIDAWDPQAAQAMMAGIVERHGATPFGFRFTTRTRGEDDLDSHVSASSPMYYSGVRVVTLAEIKAANLPADQILLRNMEVNGWHRVVRTAGGWSVPLGADDVVLEG